MHAIGVQPARLHDLFDLSNGDVRGGSHHWIEVTRGLAKHQVAPAVGLPSFDKSEVGLERVFHHMRPAIELTDLFAFSDHRSRASRREERGNSSATGANPLRQRP